MKYSQEHSLKMYSGGLAAVNGLAIAIVAMTPTMEAGIPVVAMTLHPVVVDPLMIALIAAAADGLNLGGIFMFSLGYFYFD
jgi:hypothetical protein